MIPDRPLETTSQQIAQQTLSSAFVETAQQRLLDELNEQAQHSARPYWRGWPTWLAAAAVLVLALFVPFGAKDGAAFARVQAFFDQFETLRAQIDTYAAGQLMWSAKVAVDGSGRSRFDMEQDMSIVVDPVEGMMLQLFHAKQQAAVTRLPIRGFGSTKQLDWLDQIRQYQGEAVAADELEQIDGEWVRAYRLNSEDIKATIWATEANRPVRMRLEHSGLLEMDFRFEFDQSIAEETFSLAVPSGYSEEKKAR